MRFYLSGAMEFKKDLGKAWREWITEELEKHRHDAIDPVKLQYAEEEALAKDLPLQSYLTNLKNEGQLDKVRKITRKMLFRKDMFGIQMADALILLYDDSTRRGAGTLSEAWESFREGRPIYLVTEIPLEEIPTWLVAETTEMFSTFEELLDYIKDHSRVIRDQMNARRFRDETLGGIYPT